MLGIGVSGDGDTGAIGIGQFVHLMRRNLPLIYIIEDNGCYGLTARASSRRPPTSASKAKNGVVNDLPPIDTCALAIELGASFVARSFSGDKKQLLSVLKAAIAHRGTSMIDVISPCVTFNDHEGSTKSYSYVKDHDEQLGEISFVPYFEDITVEYEPGSTTSVKMHDGSHLYLRKLAEDYNPSDKLTAMSPAARDGAARRVRHGRPLYPAGQGRFCRLAQPGRSTNPWRSCRPSGRARPKPGPRRTDGRTAMSAERTFAIIKPDAVEARARRKDPESRIEEAVDSRSAACGTCT